jgi:hypothetical protein
VTGGQDLRQVLAELDLLARYLQQVSEASHPLLNAAGIPVENDAGEWAPDVSVDLRVIELRLQVAEFRALITGLMPGPPPDPTYPGGM